MGKHVSLARWYFFKKPRKFLSLPSAPNVESEGKPERKKNTNYTKIKAITPLNRKRKVYAHIFSARFHAKWSPIYKFIFYSGLTHLHKYKHMPTHTQTDTGKMVGKKQNGPQRRTKKRTIIFFIL
jgi:hypothetical protein